MRTGDTLLSQVEVCRAGALGTVAIGHGEPLEIPAGETHRGALGMQVLERDHGGVARRGRREGPPSTRSLC